MLVEVKIGWNIKDMPKCLNFLSSAIIPWTSWDGPSSRLYWFCYGLLQKSHGLYSVSPSILWVVFVVQT